MPRRDRCRGGSAKAREARRLCAAFAGLAALTLSLAACDARPPPQPAPLAAVAVDAGADAKAPSRRKAAIEAMLTEAVTKKGVTVASAACPDDAEDHFTNKCTVTTAQGDRLEATCHGDSDAPACKLGVAFVDAAKVATMIKGELAKMSRKSKARGKKLATSVSCPEGPIVKPVGERFYCKAVSKKRTIPVDVTITSLEGAVSLAIKS